MAMDILVEYSKSKRKLLSIWISTNAINIFRAVSGECIFLHDLWLNQVSIMYEIHYWRA